jgi:protein gp37
MKATDIEWTDFSSNALQYRDGAGRVVWACAKISPGCQRCYSEAIAERFNRGKEFTVANMTDLTPFVCDKEMKHVLTAKVVDKIEVSGKRCFVGDMTDWFGSWVEDRLLDKLFAMMAIRKDVTFQVLTKRPERAAEYLNAPHRHQDIHEAVKGIMGYDNSKRPAINRSDLPLKNVWIGTSVEDQKRADERIPHLLACPAAVRFLSCEPLLGPVDLTMWLGYNPNYESIRTDGSIRSRSRENGSFGDTSRRDNMASSGADEKADMQTSSSNIEISHGQGDAGGETSKHTTSEAGLLPLQGRDTPGINRESQRRRDDKQQPGESGTGDLCGTGEALHSSSRSNAKGSIGGEERHGEADRIGSEGNTEKALSRRQTQEHREGLCGEPATSIKNSIGPTMGISWLIAGGESGHGARPCDLEWIRSIVGQCKTAEVPCFVKQLGAAPVDAKHFEIASALFKEQWGFSPTLPNQIEECTFVLKDKKGGDISEWPEDLRVRQFPEVGAA